MHNPLIHLICGSTGAGKATYSRQLSQQLGAVRFSIDEWMTTLFWMDSPRPLEPAWSMERVERCLTQIWATTSQVAVGGIPCVLDIGFTQAQSRARFIGLADQAGLSVQLHFIDVSPTERWRRVQKRNDERDGTYNLPFDVTREMFNFVETLWEPPTEHEMTACNGVRREFLVGLEGISR